MSSLADLQEWIEASTQNSLQEYLAELDHNHKKSTETREFNDPLWKTISISPFESLIVDTPLFQRLRRIKQLGVVHWVYPGAVHTRFEHSLGVVHLMQQLIDSIRATAGNDALSPQECAFLRLCALCHDLGHGVMSHVSENHLNTFPDIDELRTEFGRRHNLEKPPFSEIIAYYIINSQAFRRLVESAVKNSAPPHPPSDTVDWICKALIGQSPVLDKPLLSELISGPFDADKLDYMQRDAFMTGIPLVTDVPRLIRKIRAFKLYREQLPQNLSRTIPHNINSCLIHGVVFSGSRTLDELLLARILLFDKVYRHQKVRALEGMVARIIELLTKCFKRPVFELPYVFTDDELLIADKLIPHDSRFTVNGAVSMRCLTRLCESLRERKLFTRASVIGLHLPGDEYQKRNVESGMQMLISNLEGERKYAMENRIADEIKAAIEIIDPLFSPNWSVDEIKSLLWLAPPCADDHSRKIDRAWIICSPEKIEPYRKYSDETCHWAQAYLAKKDVGYLYCDKAISPFATLAMEKILGSQPYFFRLPESASLWVKEDIRLPKFREKLRFGNFYRDVPFSLRPTPERLKKSDVPKACEAILRKLQGYQPPVQTGARENVLSEDRPSTESIMDWLAQFEEDDLIDCGLEALSKLELIGRPTLVNSIIRFIEENPEFKESSIVCLGGPQDSGVVAGYLATDIGKHAVAMEVALEIGKPIIFVDDFIGTGTQVCDILRNWVGIKTILGESSRGELNTVQKESLKSVPISFVFGAGWNSGKKKLIDFGRELGLQLFVSVYKDDPAIPSLSDISRHPSYGRFRARCAQIGDSLLRSTKAEWDETKFDDRQLGYGNKANLIVTSFNTPSQTMTCLWSKGTYMQQQWKPLLPRREKK